MSVKEGGRPKQRLIDLDTMHCQCQPNILKTTISELTCPMHKQRDRVSFGPPDRLAQTPSSVQSRFF